MAGSGGGIAVGMKVSGVSQFNAAITNARQSVKTLDAQLKLNEKQLKATGDQEAYMSQKAQLLKTQLDAQKTAVKAAEQALKTMTEQGVDKASTAYMKMEQQLAKAQAGLLDTQQALESVGDSSVEAADGADKLASSVNSIDKKVSLDNVLTGINSITSGLENAARKAVEVGQTIWNEIMNRAQWADDTATQAMMLDMDIEQYQRYKNVFDTFAEMTVADWQKAKLKVQKAIYDPTADQIDVFAALGISPTEGGGAGKFGDAAGVAKSWEAVFWQAGQKLRQMVDSKQISQDQADVYANALFGKSFASLKPMLEMGAVEFNKAVHEQKVVTEDAVKDVATMNDTIATMKQRLETLETEIMAGLAPALTEASKAMTALLDEIITYVQSEDGQKKLESLGDAVEKLFDGLSDVEAADVIDGVSAAITSVTDGLEWIKNNWGAVMIAVKGIAIAFGLLKVSEGVLTFMQLMASGKLLFGGKAAADAATGAAASGGASTAAGAAGGSLISRLLGSQVLKNLTGAGVFLGTLFENAIKPQGNDDIFTAEEEAAYAQEHRNEILDQRLRFLGTKTRNMIHEKQKNSVVEVEEIDDAETMLNLTRDQIDAAQEYWDVMRDGASSVDQKDLAYQDLLDHFIGDDASMAQLTSLLSLVESLPESFEDLPDMWWNGGEDIIVEPEVDTEEAQKQLSENPLTVPVIPQMWGSGSVWGSGGGVPGGKWLAMPKANGLPFVPFDGYPAILHKGERVLTARENASRSFSSNLYVESMYMNNGADADGLAARIAAQNRRIMAGHGS